MIPLNRMKSRWLLGITGVVVLGVLVVVLILAGPRQEKDPSSRSDRDLPGGAGAAPAAPDELPRATKTDRDPDSSPGSPARDQSFRPSLEMSKKLKATALEATRALGEHGKKYPHSVDNPAARAELEERLAATTDLKERAILTQNFLESADEARQAAEAARTPEVLQHERRLRTLSRLESFLDLPAYISEGTEFSEQAEALLVKVADFAERSAELDDEAVIAELSTLDTAIKDLRRRRTEKMPSLLDHGDD